MEQIIKTGDPATDKEVVEEMKRSYEAAGMSAQVTSLPGGGFKIVLGMPGVPAAPAAPAAQGMAAMPPTGAFELGGEEGAKLVSAARQGSLRETLAFLATARQAGDWDDYVFMVGHVGPEASRPLLDQAAAQAPRQAEPRLLRAANAVKAAWDARGTGTADTITDEGAGAMLDNLELARRDLAEAAGLDAASPAAPAMLVEVATLHEQMSREDGQAAFRQALQRHPTHLQAFRNALRLSSQKWGGTHNEQLQLARYGLSLAAPGSDLHGCIFFAQIEIWFYMNRFEGDEDGAQAYIANPAIQAELNQAFDRWVTPQYRARRVSPPMLHLAAFWYDLVGDLARLKRAIAATGQVQVPHPWHYLGEPTVMFMQALQKTM